MRLTWRSHFQAVSPEDTRILLIDDDPALQRMVRRLLLTEGYTVDTAADGVEGLEKLAAADYSLVLLDLQMPQMDGRTMYREMRGRGHKCPVIVLSAFGADAARAELGAEAAINKPFDFDMEALIQRISTLLT